MYCFVLSLRIKYDDSKIETILLWEKCQSWFWFDRKYIWLVSCWFDQKPQLLTLLNIFFVSVWLNSMYWFVLSLRIKYDDSKNQNSSIVIYIWLKINVNSGLLICPTKNTTNPNNINWTYRTRFEFLEEIVWPSLWHKKYTLLVVNQNNTRTIFFYRRNEKKL